MTLNLLFAFLLFTSELKFVFTESLNTISNLRSPILKISTGKIQGGVSNSRNGRPFYSFLGINYGSVRRFEIAKPPESWDGVKQMTAFGSECLQIDGLTKRIKGSEDCLFLNVYTPAIHGKLPLMIWIHEGGFNSGSGNEISPAYFMDENVVLVTINYRLSVFGFLDSQDGSVEGNLGLKDQILAMQWVQQNAQVFGGDADSVTIFGSSAGAVSVNFHMLSALSKGLFHGAISQSGSALVGYAIQVEPQKNLIKLAKFVNCLGEDVVQVLRCLKSKDSMALISATDMFRKFSPEFDLNFIFTPTIESRKSKQPFISDCAEQLLSKGHFQKHIPWISGVTSNEGALNLKLVRNNQTAIQELNQNWKEIAPSLLVYSDKVGDDSSVSGVSSQIWDYFIKSGVDSTTWQNLTDIVSDRWNVHGIIQAMKYWSKYGLVYPFYFNFRRNSADTSESVKRQIKEEGVQHLGELKYLFSQYNGAPKYENSTAVGRFSQQFVKLWTSFATHGTPNTSNFKWKQRWPSISKDDAESKSWSWFQIDEEPTLVKGPFGPRMDFWDSVPISDCSPFGSHKDEL